MFVCFGVIADHPQSVFCGQNLVLKSIVALLFWRYCDVWIAAFLLETAY